MKKFFNEKHEAILYAFENYAEPTSDKHEGDAVLMRHEIRDIKYTLVERGSYGETKSLTPIVISAELIRDLYAQIQEIETPTFVSQYSELPF